ncbi:hypothetical protein CTEN210_13265 [Chaetoceros tenuissimus]|nr:hypothetical protein CTEN210_13265 [Chaetoceros tenuissimus]
MGSVEASITPSIVRSDGPSSSPSSRPSLEESFLPSLLPSMDPSNLPTKMRSDKPSSVPSESPSVKESSAPSLTTSSIPTLVSSNKPSVSSSPTTRYVCPAMSVEYNLCLQRGNYKNSFDEVGKVKFAVSTVNNEYVWELRIENFVDDIVGNDILRRDTPENIKAYVGSSPPSSNVGSYNYKFTDSLPYANDENLIAFGGLSCDNDLYFGVHLDAETGDTIWAIPCSDGSSTDFPYEQFSVGWGGYSSYSSIDCHQCTDLLLENSIFRRRLFSDEEDHIHAANSADFDCLFEENDISCPYCLSCLGLCDDECGFYSYPSEDDLLSCLENMIPECSDKCSDVCNGHFIDHIFASSSEDDNAFNMNPYDSSNHSNPSTTSTHSTSEMICSAQDMNQNACPYCDTCLAACDDECGFYTSASVEEWTTCFENLSDECVDMCKDVCRKEFSIEVK